jgi:DNA-binding beta-propeller fold protein YncE
VTLRRSRLAPVTAILAAILVGLSGMAGGPAAAATTLDFAFVTAWGSHGSAAGQFNSPPTGAAVAADGSVYVVDYSDRVQRFTGSGALLTQWGGGGQGVAVGPDGSVYVASGDYVRKFTADGTFLAEWGGHGTGPGEFNGAWGVAVGPDASVYVTDVANSRVQKFTADGAYLTQWGSHGAGAEYSNPYRVAVGPDGSVYVAEWANNRVQKFTADGGFLGQWGSPGTGPGQFDGPMGIAVGSDGLVYVAEYANNRVQVFTPNGAGVFQWGGPGAGAGQFYGVYDVAAGPQGSVYVVDYGNYRVQKFSFRMSVRTDQAITFTSVPPTDARVGGSYRLSATGGGSGNPVVFTSETLSVCTVTGTSVSFVRLGICTINANQAGNDQYAPASYVQQSFHVHAVTYLTLNATPEPAEFGSPIKAKAKLRTASGPLKNWYVRFYFRAKGATGWTYRGRDATNDRGIAVRKFTARRTGAWKARYTGFSTYLPDTATDRVKVIR